MLALALALTLSPAAHAADDDATDLDGEEGTRKPKKRRGKDVATTKVREITRGSYAKSNVGGAFYLGNFSSAVSAGSYVGAAYGKDFVDHERSSMAWEVGIAQGLHNGVDFLTQAANGCQADGGAAPCTQGDLRTYSVTAAYEYSMYPTRRVGVGVRVGAGGLYSPLLIEENAWADVVSNEFQLDPGHHNAFKPIVFGGPTIEYYTKLSHFSVGVDVDVVYGIGWDLGMNTSGALKYTF